MENILLFIFLEKKVRVILVGMGKNSEKWNDVSKNQVNIIRKQNPARMQDSKEFCYQSDLKIGEKK